MSCLWVENLKEDERCLLPSEEKGLLMLIYVRCPSWGKEPPWFILPLSPSVGIPPTKNKNKKMSDETNKMKQIQVNQSWLFLLWQRHGIYDGWMWLIERLHIWGKLLVCPPGGRSPWLLVGIPPWSPIILCLNNRENMKTMNGEMNWIFISICFDILIPAFEHNEHISNWVWNLSAVFHFRSWIISKEKKRKKEKKVKNVRKRNA